MYETTIAKLVAAGFGQRGDFEGASEAQIAAIEARFARALPAAYRAFLAEMGRRRGTFLVGTDIGVEWNPPFNEGLEHLEPAIDLPAATFVFLSHQGYSFAAFDAAAGEDPPVFMFVDGSPSVRHLDQPFSEWIDRAADDEIALRSVARSNC